MKIIRVFILLLATLVFSAEFQVVSDIRELPGDLTAQRYGYKDVNGDWCAILKVHTDINGLLFESMGYEKHDYNTENGIYLVYLQPQTRRIRFAKEGYIAKNYEFPFKVESNKVYMMEVKGTGEGLEEIEISIETEPSGATLYLDGENKGEVSTINTSIGKHELSVSKSGYQPVTDSISVSMNENIFNYTLKEVGDVLVEIDSEPQGATVYLNDVMLNNPTPTSAFYPAGIYKIKLVSDKFKDFEENIIIKSPGIKKAYKLSDISATLTINTYEEAEVYINGEKVINFKEMKLSPQVLSVRIEMTKAEPLEEKIILNKNEVKTVDLFPKIPKGKIQIAVIPSDADIKLWEDGYSEFKSSGSKSFEVPAGNYKLTVKKEGYQTYKEEIVVKESSIERRSISLKTGSDVSDDFVMVEGGAFLMGSERKSLFDQAKHVHKVILDDFYLKKTEVTQKEWKAVMGRNPSENTGVFKNTDDFPVENVSWRDAVEYCNKLSEMENLDKCYSITENDVKCDFKADGYRLATEAEWEYAAKGGNKSKGFIYSGSDDLKSVANRGSETIKVGSLKPNELGIYDLTGNIWEWCWDFFDYKYYAESPERNPTGPDSGKSHILRGGSFSSVVDYCKNYERSHAAPTSTSKYYGFRTVRRP